MSDDRTVHAAYEGMEIVRYDRSGKWYLEPTDPRLKRQHVSLAKAIASASWGLDHGGWAEARLPGGQAFDNGLRRIREIRGTA